MSVIIHPQLCHCLRKFSANNLNLFKFSGAVVSDGVQKSEKVTKNDDKSDKKVTISMKSEKKVNSFFSQIAKIMDIF